MGLLKSRGVTFAVALATLISNTLSSVLFQQLPDDPYHLAGNFGWYLHFANILSIFGFVGAVREHALSVAIFSNYLIIDTILCSIPRFLVLALLQQFSVSLCSPEGSYLDFSASHEQTFTSLSAPSPDTSSTSEPPYLAYAKEWSPAGCRRIVTLLHVTLAAGVVAATLLQFVGALCVREYAKSLFVRGMLEEGRLLASEERRSLCEERGLPIIEEDSEREKLGL
ncbi:hypothetical protein CJF32_00003637 [Rutstroemia sp. NJR-2017a WRK4]|nr:hypothetical protein CJF32_00003637 [Rutstroemia sp. NJR-2017a WRK4]